MSEESVIYTLKNPIQVGSETVTELTLREPTALQAGDLEIELPASEGMETLKINAKSALKVIKASCAEPPTTLNKMKLSDVTMCYFKCLELFFADTE